MKKIIFRADGNSTIGLGHLYRAFALIEMYKTHYEFILLTKESSAAFIPSSYSTKFIPDTIRLAEEPEWISKQFEPIEHIIISDGYGFKTLWQKEIKQLKFQLVCIDDLCEDHMYADIVVNHAIGITPMNYKAQAYTKFALGTQYAILRPLFLAAAKESRIIDNYQSVFVCFGGSDPLNLGLKSVKALLLVPTINSVNIVLGAAYSHTEIFEIAKQDSRVTIYQNISETILVEVMKTCHFAIASASTILYELCAVKMPVLAGYYVENQKKLYQGCVSNKLIFGMGTIKEFSESDFENQINKFLLQDDKTTYITAQSVLFDGNIKQRYLDLLQSTEYRKAETKDMNLVFEWANDPVTRANSFHSEPILLETHKTWFEKKLKDTSCFIYIAERENNPAGLVRYEVSENNSVVGILIDEKFRGKGLASRFLKETAVIYFKESTKPVLAYIKKTNKASVKAFEKAGYSCLREEVVQNHASFVYILKKENVQ